MRVAIRSRRGVVNSEDGEAAMALQTPPPSGFAGARARLAPDFLLISLHFR
jgi:hypothetical protein